MRLKLRALSPAGVAGALSSLILIQGCSSPATPDQAWMAVTSTGNVPAAVPGADELTGFMRSVELADAERREEGLKFWKDHSNDPRRYEWLVMTVHAPPHYAADVNAWAAAATRTPEANGTAIDKKAQQAWDIAYPRLRRAFWNAPSTTDDDRRFLWSGELTQGYRRAADAHARGEVVDLGPLNASLFEFLQAYPAWRNEEDAGDYTVCVDGPLRAALEVTEAVASPAARKALSDRLAALGGTTRGLVESYDAMAENREDDEGPWALLRANTISLAPPKALGAKALDWRRQLIQRRIQRAQGIVLWSSMPADVRYSWLQRTIDEPPQFTRRMEDAMRVYASSGKAPDEDLEAARKSDEALHRLEREYLSSTSTPAAHRADLAGLHLFARLKYDEDEFRSDKSKAEAFLADVHAYNMEYGSSQGAKWDLLYGVMKNYPRWGISNSKVLETFDPLRRSSIPSAREMVTVLETRIRAESTPFEFKANTLDGQPFDIASLRGKIVLVDHWSTSCSSCIAAMPRIHDIYKRYQSRGFEVVSIAYNQRSEVRRVRRIEEEKGLTWTTLIAGDQWAAISEKYGYTGVPQYMLLRRDGTLYAGTGEVDLGRGLEAMLDEMLAAEARNRPARPRPN